MTTEFTKALKARDFNECRLYFIAEKKVPFKKERSLKRDGSVEEVLDFVATDVDLGIIKEKVTKSLDESITR